MAMIKILRFFPNSEGWHEGDVVDLANPTPLLKDGYVEYYVSPKKEKVEKNTKGKSDKTKTFFGIGGGGKK
jgi:hypothetical protein